MTSKPVPITPPPRPPPPPPRSQPTQPEAIKMDGQTAAVLDRKCYRIGKKLTEGSMGQVYKALNTSTGESVAVKVIELSKLGPRYKKKFMPRELTTLIGIHHENLIYIYDIIRNSQKFFIFMEFANGGDIAGYLGKNGPIPEPLTCYWFNQICRALHYLQEELRFAHQNIKMENVVLHNNIAQLTDFGFLKPESNIMDHQSNQSMETLRGSDLYLCPQQIGNKSYDTFAADIWALGVILFCMLNNKFPYQSGADLLKMIQENEQVAPSAVDYLKERYCRKFGEDLQNLQEQLLEPDEKKRITIAPISDHPWILRKGK